MSPTFHILLTFLSFMTSSKFHIDNLLCSQVYAMAIMNSQYSDNQLHVQIFYAQKQKKVPI